MSVVHQLKEFFGFTEEEEAPELNLNVTKEVPQRPVVKPFKGTIMHNQTSPVSIAEIKIEEPRIYEDSLNIAAHLRDNKPVLVNLKYLDNVSGKRLIDFVCGTAYALNGHMMKIGENIFLFTPAHILIADPAEKSSLDQGMENDEKEVFFKRVAAS